MNQLTNDLFARRYLGEALSEDVVAWALAMLEAGYDTESLGILAGLTPPYLWQELDLLLKHALGELGWSMPDAWTAVGRFARYIAADIVVGKMGVCAGQRLIDRTIEAAWHVDISIPGALSDWYMDTSEELPEGGTDELSYDEVVDHARRYLAETADMGM